MKRTLPACCIFVLALCCAAPLLQPLLAADVKPAVKPAVAAVPWHVPNAELRVPVKVAMTNALLRMPPQVYLADLKPLGIPLVVQVGRGCAEVRQKYTILLN